MIYNSPTHPRPVVLSQNTTLFNRHFTVESEIVVDTAAVTLTLPPGNRDIIGQPTWLVNNSDGNITLSGAFLGGGTSYTVASGFACWVVCLPVTSSVYKWCCLAGQSAEVTYGAAEDIAATSDAAAAGSEESAARTDHVHPIGEHAHDASDTGGTVDHGDLDNAGSNSHGDIDTFIGTTVPAYFNTTTGHAHDGADSAPVALANVTGYTAPDTWTSTLVFGTATPTVTKVARYCEIGKMVFFLLNITTDDGAGGKFESATLPVTPKDVDGFWQVNATLTIGSGAPTVEICEIDGDSGSGRKLLGRSQTEWTDDSAVRLSISGFYEVA